MDIYLGDKVCRYWRRHKQEGHDQELVCGGFSDAIGMKDRGSQQHADAYRSHLCRRMKPRHGIVELQKSNHPNQDKT